MLSGDVSAELLGANKRLASLAAALAERELYAADLEGRHGAAEAEASALRSSLALREGELRAEGAARSAEAVARSEAVLDAESARRQLGEALGRAMAAEAEAEGLHEALEKQVKRCWVGLMMRGGSISGGTSLKERERLAW